MISLKMAHNRRKNLRMKMRRVSVGAIVALIFSSLGATQPVDPKLPAGEGKEVTERVCSACHGIDLVASERHSKAEWQKVSDDMVARGADATEAEVKVIVEYLAKYFGPKPSR
jgi:mono/diheme cytochrome c family protein